MFDSPSHCRFLLKSPWFTLKLCFMTERGNLKVEIGRVCRVTETSEVASLMRAKSSASAIPSVIRPQAKAKEAWGCCGNCGIADSQVWRRLLLHLCCGRQGWGPAPAWYHSQDVFLVPNKRDAGLYQNGRQREGWERLPLDLRWTGAK